jgi:phage terminase large subunit-like protein
MAKTKRGNEVFTKDEMLRTMLSGLKKQSNHHNLYAYEPHVKQVPFHNSAAHTRLYIGGNRSGKTTAGVVEDIFWAIGRHPYRKVPEAPTNGRVVGVDFPHGVEKVLIPEFKRWLPPSFLKNGSWDDSFSKELNTLTLVNNSTIEFMSYEQSIEKFSGTSRHYTHYDEEPPQHIFNECEARLVDTDGSSWLTMTPVEGMTWVYDAIFLPATTGKNKDYQVVEVDMLENPHVDPAAAERYLKNLDPDERTAREHGKFVQLGGLVYKAFTREIHVKSSDGLWLPPPNWELYASVDHGYNNPTAWLFHAVSPEGYAVTFMEHYQSGWVVKQHAEKFFEMCKEIGREPDFIVGDPALAQHQGVTGTSIFEEYAEYGVYIAPGQNKVETGVNKVATYMRLSPNGKPWWQVTENCTNTIEELLRLRWKTWSSRENQFKNNKHETIHKKDDHAADSLRYFATFLPDLRPDQLDITQKQQDASVLGVVVTGSPTTGNWDHNLNHGKVPEFAKDFYREDVPTRWAITEGSDLQGFED